MFLDPEGMGVDFQLRVVSWLEANGCRDWVAMEPIVVRGRLAWYTSMGRKGRPIVVRGDSVVTRRKCVRIRIPLSEIPEA